MQSDEYKRTVYSFTVSRRDSLDPHEAICDASRQAIAESAVAAAREEYTPAAIDFEYSREDSYPDTDFGYTDLTAWGVEEAVRCAASVMEERYGLGVEVQDTEVSR